MIFINDIPSLRNPERNEYNFDDRITKVELINGTAYQDYGHVKSGDSYSITCAFSCANYERFKAILQTRPRPYVTFTDEAGEVHSDLLPVFKNIHRIDHFYKYVVLSFDLLNKPDFYFLTGGVNFG